MTYAPERLSACCSRVVNVDAAHRCSGCGEPLGTVYCERCGVDLTPPDAPHTCDTDQFTVIPGETA